jgi:hypothetical protein
MGTTPTLHLPYPELTDTADVPRDMQALATALDTWGGRVPLVQPSDLSNPPYNTPFSGQEVDLAVSNQIWRLRWNTAIADPYKWVFVGGAPLQAFEATSFGSSLPGTWVNIGPNLTIPRAGIYQIHQTAVYFNPGPGSTTVFLTMAPSGSTTPSVYAQMSQGEANTPLNQQTSIVSGGVTNALTAGQVLSGLFQSADGQGAGTSQRMWELQPVRVS